MLGEKKAAERKKFCTRSVGEPAEIANAGKALGQDVL